jgi:Protein of unknown function (DUF2752)
MKQTRAVECRAVGATPKNPRLRSRTHRTLVLVLAGTGAIAVLLGGLATGRTICIFYGLSGRLCPGCGMTEAIVALALGDIGRAWELNRLSLLTAPLLLGAAFRGWQTRSADAFRPPRLTFLTLMLLCLVGTALPAAMRLSVTWLYQNL